MRCGYCKAYRETGKVCCLEQAANQGRLHADCDHDPPAGLAGGLLAAYLAAARGVVDDGADESPPASYPAGEQE